MPKSPPSRAPSKFSVDDIPPAVRVLIDESVGNFSNASNIERVIKRLIPELKAQASWTTENFTYFEARVHKPSEMIAVVSGGLNPLSIQGACQDINRLRRLTPYTPELDPQTSDDHIREFGPVRRGMHGGSAVAGSLAREVFAAPIGRRRP